MACLNRGSLESFGFPRLNRGSFESFGGFPRLNRGSLESYGFPRLNRGSSSRSAFPGWAEVASSRSAFPGWTEVASSRSAFPGWAERQGLLTAGTLISAFMRLWFGWKDWVVGRPLQFQKKSWTQISGHILCHLSCAHQRPERSHDTY